MAISINSTMVGEISSIILDVGNIAACSPHEIILQAHIRSLDSGQVRADLFFSTVELVPILVMDDNGVVDDITRANTGGPNGGTLGCHGRWEAGGSQQRNREDLGHEHVFVVVFVVVWMVVIQEN